MYDGSAIAAAELRFREDLWRTAPTDAVKEAEVRCHWFGPILATVFGDLPDSDLMNRIHGIAEPGALENSYLAEAIEWVRAYEVDYRIAVIDDRPGTEEAEDWLELRGYEPGSTMRRYLRPATTPIPDACQGRLKTGPLLPVEKWTTSSCPDPAPGGLVPPAETSP